MYALWFDAFLHSRFDRVGRSMGLQRAVLDLAYCMQNDVDETGRDMLSNGELQDKIRRDLRGGRITYKMLDPKLLPLSRWAEWRLGSPPTTNKEWLNNKKWELAFFVGSLGFLAAAIAGTHAPLITAILLVLAAGTVLLIGKNHKSRWLIFLFFVIIAIALGPIGPYVYLDKSHYALIWLQQDPYYELAWWYNQ